ncbi:MAG: tetratricopeptide repeat protein [Planctomycetota bacterium]
MSRHQKLLDMLSRSPDDVFLNFAVAMEFSKGGETDQAVAHFDRALGCDDKYLAAYYHKGSALLQVGRVEQARSTLLGGISKARQLGDQHAAEEMETLLAGMPG